MYIAICDDQEKELAALEGLLSAWQKERQHPVRVKIFRNAVDRCSGGAGLSDRHPHVCV